MKYKTLREDNAPPMSIHLYDLEAALVANECDNKIFFAFERALARIDFNGGQFTLGIKHGQVNIVFSGVAEQIIQGNYFIKELKIKNLNE